MSYKINANGISSQMMEDIAAAFSLEFPDNLYKLTGYFSNENWLMRKIASEYCARLGKDILPHFLDFLTGENVSEDCFYWGVKTITRFAGASHAPAASAVIIELMSFIAGNYRIGDYNKLLYLIKACGVMKDIAAVPLLIEQLGHAGWIVRKEAAAALMQIGRPAAPMLKEAFSSGNKDIRYWTVKLLGQLLGADAVDSFKKLLKSEKKDLRYYALTALGENDGEEIICQIVNCLGDESWLVRAQAAEILEKKGRAAINVLKRTFSSSANSDVKYWTIKVLSKMLKDEAADYMERIIETDDSELKYCIIEALAQMKFNRAAPLLLKLLDDNAWLVRKHVASVFTKFGTQASAFLLEKLDGEENENIRYWAVQIISRGEGSHFNRLLKILKDPERCERPFIIQALREAKNEQALPALLDLLADRHWTIRREAAYALAEYGQEKFIDALIKHGGINNGDTKFWTRKILASFNGSAFDVVAKCINNAETHGETEKLERLYSLIELIESPKVCDLIVETLKGKKSKNKELLCLSLKDVKNEKFINNLLKVLGEEDAGVCYFIARIIKNISKSSYHLLYNALDDNNAEKRVWICKIFSEICDNSFIAPLMVLLSDENKNVRYEATRALAKFESDEVFERLIKRFIDEDEEGRICIIENVKSLIDTAMVNSLIETLNDCSDTDAYWISKLLVETASQHLELLELSHDGMDEKSPSKYWLKKIIDHIKGISYL